MNEMALNDPPAEMTALQRQLRSLLIMLWARRWWIILSTVLVTAVCWAYAFFGAPVYRAATVVVPAPANAGLGGGSLDSALGQLGGLASLAGVELGGDGRDLDEALGVLSSREFTQNFIERKGLRPILFADKWDTKTGKWKVPVELQPTPARAFRYFDRGVRTIIRDRRSSLITVQIEWKDRKLAAEWANDLVRQVNAEMRSRAIREADVYVSYLEKELAQTSVVATRDAISRLIESSVKKRMVANVTHEFAFRVVDTALAPDADNPVRPRRLVLAVAGPTVGGLVGVLLVLSYSLVFGSSQASRMKD